MKSIYLRTVIVRFVAIVLCSFVVCGPCVSVADAETKVRIGTQPSLGMLPIRYGIEKGFFAVEGLDIELVTIQPGPPIIAALMAGEIDAGWIASIPTILARANKVPVKLFANIVQEQLPDNPSSWFMTTKTSGVISMTDMRRKTVMINANGALVNFRYESTLPLSV